MISTTTQRGEANIPSKRKYFAGKAQMSIVLCRVLIML